MGIELTEETPVVAKVVDETYRAEVACDASTGRQPTLQLDRQKVYYDAHGKVIKTKRDADNNTDTFVGSMLINQIDILRRSDELVYIDPHGVTKRVPMQDTPIIFKALFDRFAQEARAARQAAILSST